MTTSLSPHSPTFTPEQRRILGQVYNLILSWRREEKKLDADLSGATESHIDETANPDPTRNGGSND